MAATVTNAGLDLLIQWALSIAPVEPVVAMLFSAPSGPTPDSVFADYVQPTIPGSTITPLNPGNWSNQSVGGRGDYVYPVIPFTFGVSSLGETILGYIVYTSVSQTVLWVELFQDPWVIPPTGGLGYLNLEVADINAP